MWNATLFSFLDYWIIFLVNSGIHLFPHHTSFYLPTYMHKDITIFLFFSNLYKPYYLSFLMPRTQLGEMPMSQNPFWAIFHVAEIWLADRYGALKPDWLNSPMLKTPLSEIPMPENPFLAIFHVAEIWLADRFGALKPDWLNSLMPKTLLGEIPMPENPFWAIFHVAEFWLVDRYGAVKPDWLICMEPWNLIRWIPRCLKPHWAKSPCLKTSSERFSMLLKSDWIGQTDKKIFFKFSTINLCITLSFRKGNKIDCSFTENRVLWWRPNIIPLRALWRTIFNWLNLT